MVDMATKGAPGAQRGPISSLGGRGGKTSGGRPKGSNTPAGWPRPAGNVQTPAGKYVGGRGPISGLGGRKRSSASKPNSGSGAPGASGGNGTTQG